MSDNSLALHPLSLDELITLAQEFSPVAGDEGGPASDWAAWWYWRTTSEIADRIDVPREPQPDIGGLSDLSPAELRLLRDYFGTELFVLAETVGSGNLAAWCAALGAQCQEQLNRLDRNRDEFQAIVDEKRRHRPHGTPGDTRGIPKWSKISGPPR